MVTGVGFHDLVNHVIAHTRHGKLRLDLGCVGGEHEPELFVELALHLGSRFACNDSRLLHSFFGDRGRGGGRGYCGIGCILYCFIHIGMCPFN